MVFFINQSRIKRVEKSGYSWLISLQFCGNISLIIWGKIKKPHAVPNVPHAVSHVPHVPRPVRVRLGRTALFFFVRVYREIRRVKCLYIIFQIILDFLHYFHVGRKCFDMRKYAYVTLSMLYNTHSKNGAKNV